jgi:hypothetical protein
MNKKDCRYIKKKRDHIDEIEKECKLAIDKIDKINKIQKYEILQKLNTTRYIKLLILEKICKLANNRPVDFLYKIEDYIMRNYITKDFLEYVDFTSCSNIIITEVISMIIIHDCPQKLDLQVYEDVKKETEDRLKYLKKLEQLLKLNNMIVSNDFYISDIKNELKDIINIKKEDDDFINGIVFLIDDDKKIKVLSAYMKTYIKSFKSEILWTVIRKYKNWSIKNKDIRNYLIDELEILFWKFYKVNILYKRHQADLNFGAKHTLNRFSYIKVEMLNSTDSDI